MNFLDRVANVWERLGSYQPWEVIFELTLIWLVVYAIFRFVQGTRAAGAMKGVLVVFVVVTLTARIVSGDALPRLGYLYERFLGLLAFTMVVLFQPELRRALIRLGEAPFFKRDPTEVAFIVDQIAEACAYLSKNRFGAIIVIERQVRLEGLTEGGTPVKAELSTRLLQTIFHPGSALHDLAVVVRGTVLTAASVQLPLAEPEDMPEPNLGSRHRAAVGLSKECDALVVIVSEESGHIRIAERGVLTTGYSPEVFRAQFRAKLERSPTPGDEGSAEESNSLTKSSKGALSEGDEPKTHVPTAAEVAEGAVDDAAGKDRA